MSREIKFRARCTTCDESHWVYFSLYATDGTWTNGHVVDDETTEQFTGLKDKHDREIYEGDIVEQSGHKSTVEFHKGAFIKRQAPKYEDIRRYFLVGETHNRLTVIGNIYENPDLIKEAA